MRLGWLAVAALLAGCSSPSPVEDAPATPPPSAMAAAADAWAGRDRILVASQEWDATTFSLDLLCLFGGEWYVPRTGEPVPAGTGSFEVVVETGPLYTGLQVGLQYRDGEILWLEDVANERRAFRVEVLPEQAEADGREAWTFWYRDIVNGDPELCYSGVAVGERTVAIEAVKA